MVAMNNNRVGDASANSTSNTSTAITFKSGGPAPNAAASGHTNAFRSKTNGNGNGSNNNTSSVTATILSTYDLPSRDPPPSYVELVIDTGNGNGNATNGSGDTGSTNTLLTAQTGPPTQRHKDRHSFKFNSDTLHVSHPSLAQLHQATARISVVYPKTTTSGSIDGSTEPSTTVLSARYPLSQLKIHETVWLVLPLEAEDGGISASNATSTALTLKSSSTTSSTAGVTANTNTDDSTSLPPQPTVRLQITMTGPYRSEISLALTTLQSWFRAVDDVQHLLDATVFGPLQKVVLEPLVNLISTTTTDARTGNTNRQVHYKYLVLPAAPVLVGIAVTLPIVIGIIVITLPLALPIVVAILAALSAAVLAACLVYASTANGRRGLQPIFTPMIQTLLSTPIGQGMVYNIGPRPTPVSLCRSILPTDIWWRFAISVAIDALGSSSYLLPGVGEGFDVAWAPIQTVLIMALYNNPNAHAQSAQSAMEYLKYISFAEEILPFTDILPTATMGWCMEYGLPLVTSQLGNNDVNGSTSTSTATSSASSASSNPGQATAASNNRNSNTTTASSMPSTVVSLRDMVHHSKQQ